MNYTTDFILGVSQQYDDIKKRLHTIASIILDERKKIRKTFSPQLCNDKDFVALVKYGGRFPNWGMESVEGIAYIQSFYLEDDNVVVAFPAVYEWQDEQDFSFSSEFLNWPEAIIREYVRCQEYGKHFKPIQDRITENAKEKARRQQKKKDDKEAARIEREISLLKILKEKYPDV